MASKRTATLGLTLAVALLVGCAGSSMFKTYPSRLDPIRSQAATGDYAAPKETLDSILDSSNVSDRVLYLQEHARITSFDTSNLESSIVSYDEAIEILEVSDEALITASGTASQGASLLTSDNAISYSSPSHERTLIRTFQALNYLERGSPSSADNHSSDLTRARIEMENAEHEQKMLRERMEAEVEKLQAQIREENAEASNNGSNLPPVGAAPPTGNGQDEGFVMNAFNGVPQLASTRQGMEDSVAGMKSAYENAYSYYVSGLIHELDGNPDMALQEYANALVLQPNNHYLQDTAFRLSKSEDTNKPQLAEYEERHGKYELREIPGNQGRVVVLLEQGFVDPKQQIKVPIPIGSRIYTIALPYYAPTESDATFSEILVDGQSLGPTQELLDIRRLAVRALLDEYKLILLRQALRLTVKDLAQRGLEEVGGAYASLAFGIADAIVTNADMRSWLTLPASVQIASFHLSPGERELLIRNAQGVESKVNITLEEDEIVLVRAHELSNGRIRANVIDPDPLAGF